MMDALPVERFAVYLLPFSTNSMSFKLRDESKLNEYSLCVLDISKWWATSLSLTWHKDVFVYDFFFVF